MNKRSRAKCLVCGDVIESKHRHDFVTCSCGNLSLDGGNDYMRILFTKKDKHAIVNDDGVVMLNMENN